jgi:serine protease Do
MMKPAVFILAFVCSVFFSPVTFAKPSKKDPIIYKSSFADVAEMAKDSVVNVASLNLIQNKEEMAHRGHNLFIDPKKDLFGVEMLNAPERLGMVGSGFIIKKEGERTYYVVTNNHVIDNTISMRVILADESIHHATLVGKDPDTDIAVLKFETHQNIRVLEWGDSEKLRIGEWSIVLGNPYGLGGTSLTTGVISYLARDLNLSAGNTKLSLVDNYIQTEAAINPGNSGGPLLNMEGKVIGVNTSIISTSGSNHSVGFAVPASLALEVVEKLIAHGKVRRAWLGTGAQALNQDIKAYFNLKDTQGALITKVTKGSPAEKAGIKEGDVVVSINSKPIKKFSDLTIVGKKLEVGKKANFEVLRNGKNLTLHPVLQEYQEHDLFKNNLRFENAVLENHAYNDDFEFGVTPLTLQFRQRFDITDLDIDGALISDVKEEGIAEQFTFSQGDVILEINGKKVRHIDDVNAIIKHAIKTNLDKPILFLLYRGPHNIFVAINPNIRDAKKRALQSQNSF